MDQKLLFLINRQWTGPVLDRFMALMSSFGAWTLPLIVLLAVVLWRGGFRARAFVLTAALLVGISDGVIARTLKQQTDRPRPHQLLQDVRMVELGKATPRLLGAFREPKTRLSRPSGVDVEGRSFPSSHTMNTITVALVCACFYRRWGWLTFFPALIVGYSRIYTGSHFPSDVLTSIFLGMGTTLFMLAGLEWLWRKYGGRLLPEVHEQHPSLFTP